MKLHTDCFPLMTPSTIDPSHFSNMSFAQDASFLAPNKHPKAPNLPDNR